MPITSTASHRLSIDWARHTGSTAMAQISIVILRAALTLIPAFIIRPDIQPPTTLPTSEATSGGPKLSRSSP
jgi:hypothetical protein